MNAHHGIIAPFYYLQFKPMTSSSITQFEARKQDHIRLALDDQNEAIGGSGLHHITLPHCPFPELDLTEVDLSCKRFGDPERVPFIVSSMTAGHHDGVAINRTLAIACAKKQWAMGVGSQRRELFDADAGKEWQEIRHEAPEVKLYGNLGLAQLIKSPLGDIERLIDSLHAKALFIHCNPLQECLQPEGTPQFTGGLTALETLCKKISIPVILKETGCGFSSLALQRLINTGVSAVDVSGYGGTHWGRIEGQRALDNDKLAQTAETFKHWGITTVDSLQAANKLAIDYELWASGGIRSGLDAAKVLALGASTVGLAKPMLQAALKGEAVLLKLMETLEYELSVALFCTGSRDIYHLQENYRAHQ